MSNSSHLNKSNVSDENTNILNENDGLNYQNKNKIINNENIITNESNKNLNSLKLFFPFKDIKELELKNEDENIYLNTEYKKLVDEILKKEELNSSFTENKYLEGKINILDKIIKRHSNIKNITQIKELRTLKLTINKNFGMLNDIGYYLPNLLELNLEGSEVSSILDIGISFQNLIKLNVSNCKLLDLSGIVCFKKLEELNANNNMIKDLIDLEMCNEIQTLKLSNNKIEEEDNLYFLVSCEKLKIIYLNGNIIADKIKEKKELKEILNSNIQIILD
jgi:hypothetical protein